MDPSTSTSPPLASPSLISNRYNASPLPICTSVSDSGVPDPAHSSGSAPKSQMNGPYGAEPQATFSVTPHMVSPYQTNSPVMRFDRNASCNSLINTNPWQPVVEDRFVSILVHIVSHSDLLVSLRTASNSEMIGRPKFSFFHATSTRIFEKIRLQEDLRKAAEPVFYTAQGGTERNRPVGFNIDPVPFDEWAGFRVKTAQEDQRGPQPVVTGVFFPQLAVIVPRWLRICQPHRAQHENTGTVLFLLSGSGTPWNKEHLSEDNSTENCAELMQHYLNRFFPEIDVHIVHSGPEIFHYDENVKFVNTDLRPRIEEIRRELAHMYSENWSRHFHLTMSISSGPPARVAAVSASLRQFKPDALHLWQLKTFWHEFPRTELKEEDVEHHSFENLETTPAVSRHALPSGMRMLVEQMIQHKQAFEKVRDLAPENELERFWLRKSQQPVLSVLMVQKSLDSKPRFYRGINVEVSMPTGTLCSERNAIGCALAADPSLLRKDLKMICVLTLPLRRKDSLSVAGSSLKFPPPPPLLLAPAAGSSASESVHPVSPSFRSLSDHAISVESPLRPAVFSREVQNPINPCGACTEWLKKIADANPDFKVLTFTDTTCDEVFVKSVYQ